MTRTQESKIQISISILHGFLLNRQTDKTVRCSDVQQITFIKLHFRYISIVFYYPLKLNEIRRFRRLYAIKKDEAIFPIIA